MMPMLENLTEVMKVEEVDEEALRNVERMVVLRISKAHQSLDRPT